MPDYKKMYLALFNDVTDIIEELKRAQQKAEELCVSGRKSPQKLTPALPPEDDKTAPE